MKNVPNHVSQQKLRKLADRAITVVHRSGSLDRTIMVVGTPLVPSAEAYIGAYDAVRVFEAKQLAAMVQGRAMLVSLHTRIRAWVGILVQDVPSFDPAELEGTVDEPEHLFADAKRLVDVVQGQPAPLPYSEELVNDLAAQAERARTDWIAARDAIVRLQDLRAAVRATAQDFRKRLVALRRTLRAVVGTRHQDYQALRGSRVFDTDDEPLEPEVVATQPVTSQPVNGQPVPVAPSAPIAVPERQNGTSRPPVPPA